MTKTRKLILTVLLLCVCLVLALPINMLRPCTRFGEEERYVYIYPDHTSNDVGQLLRQQGVRSMASYNLLCKVLGYKVRPGRYRIGRGDNMLSLFRRLRNGQQEPVMLTIPSVRTMDRMAGYLGNHLMVDSTEFATLFSDSLQCAQLGYTCETLPALFIPNTYEVYWNISRENLMQRLQRENEAFWTTEREGKAKAMGMSRKEVATLASIIDEETANNQEKPMVAGMYVNRLRVGMPLQADPTVKFALGDFSLRRIWGKYLTIDSPYNTYQNLGLPPGPIRVASVAGIDAVLNYVRHDFLYMCAKEDFSGTHNFARTYGEHLQNARRYAQALNQRGIK